VYGVYLDAKGRVLLIQDASSGLWGFPGGRIEERETRRVALGREFLEETGTKIQGSVTYITQQNDALKQRYFYKIQTVEGQLSRQGNGVDVARGAYFAVTKLPVDNLAPGVENIIKRIH